MTVVKGGAVSGAMIVAVFLSNIPEALTSSTGLLANGWKKRSVLGLWLAVIVMSILSAVVGYSVFAGTSGVTKAFILSFAGGAILTMFADTMIPEAYRDSGKFVWHPKNKAKQLHEFDEILFKKFLKITRLFFTYDYIFSTSSVCCSSAKSFLNILYLKETVFIDCVPCIFYTDPA